jgi:hypothetical protein
LWHRSEKSKKKPFPEFCGHPWAFSEPILHNICDVNCLIRVRSLLFYQFKRRARKLALVIIVGYHFYQLHTKFYPIFFSQG